MFVTSTASPTSITKPQTTTPSNSPRHESPFRTIEPVHTEDHRPCYSHSSKLSDQDILSRFLKAKELKASAVSQASSSIEKESSQLSISQPFLPNKKQTCHTILNMDDKLNQPTKVSGTSILHTPPIYICQKCNKQFKYPGPYLHHCNNHVCNKKTARDTYDKYECDICHAVLSTRYNFNEHITKHTDRKHYQCAVCNKKYISQRTMKTHTKTFHSTPKLIKHSTKKTIKKDKTDDEIKFKNNPSGSSTTDTLFLCSKPGCCKLFEKKSQFDEHMSKHQKYSLHACSQCSKSYARFHGLKRHLKTKHNTTPPSDTANSGGATFKDGKTPQISTATSH
ncbi:MAG: C2H2-type zinc finger protein [Endozoicomonadaceae bacterium]|nr:C2H2-type zinc finger protein [Endozoicomonadaceae bacterium]